MNEFIQRALNEGFDFDLVREAADTSDAETYDDFAEDLVKVANKRKERMEQEEKRRQLANEIIRSNVKRLESMLDFDAHLISLIQGNYNTTAVSLKSLGERIKEKLDSHILETYKSPLYYAAYNIKAPLVHDAVKECLASWTTDMDAVNFVRNYYADNGIDFDSVESMCQDAISQLPDNYNIKNEESPEIYKAVRFVEIMSGENFSIAEEKISVSEKAGVALGKIVTLQDSVKKTFNDAVNKHVSDFNTGLEKELHKHDESTRATSNEKESNSDVSVDTTAHAKDASDTQQKAYTQYSNTGDFSPNISKKTIAILVFGMVVFLIMLFKPRALYYLALCVLIVILIRAATNKRK